jgi:hypothetical protein
MNQQPLNLRCRMSLMRKTTGYEEDYRRGQSSLFLWLMGIPGQNGTAEIAAGADLSLWSLGSWPWA